MTKTGNITATSNKATATGYETRPDKGRFASRPPRKVIFGAGGNKSTTVSTTIKKS